MRKGRLPAAPLVVFVDELTYGFASAKGGTRGSRACVHKAIFR
jgi:hypothetical protein